MRLTAIIDRVFAEPAQRAGENCGKAAAVPVQGAAAGNGAGFISATINF